MKIYLLSILLLFLTAMNLSASEPSVWSINTRTEILKGDARGVSVDDAGAITIAPKLTEVFKTGQSYIWSSAVDTAGNVYLGTGGDGKIFKVDVSGKGALFADLNELNVSALAIGKSGDLYAASSPDGKVYKIDASGKTEVFFDPKQKYIWSLAMMPDGSLAVGTGESGKIYKVKSANASPDASLFYDTSETHIISLAADKEGNLYAGTDSSGLVLRFSPDGKPFALLDSPLREIQELVVGSDGSIYALALGESASVKPAEAPAIPAAENKTVSANKPNPMQPETPVKSRYDLKEAKSAVYRILPDGGSDVIWASASVTGFSLYAHQTGNGVLLGTSDKGRIYSITNDGRETLVLESGASQISTIRAAGQSLLATSSNQGVLYRFGSEMNPEGSYESTILDAKSTASWGRIWWQSNGTLQIQTRSGNTEKPDETWSAWSTVNTTAMSGQVTSPKARFLQWRAVLKNSQAKLGEVNVSFLGRNIAPEVLSISILPTNVGLAPSPPVQIDPNIQLSGLDPATFGIPVIAVPPRRVFQRAATSLQWTAEDRNGDKLIYDIFYKEVGEANFKPLRENIAETFYTIDGQALADGRYVFKIIAKDSPSNPSSLALSGERISEPIDIDNTAPVVMSNGTAQISGNTARVTFTAADKSYLTRAEYSVNGSDWIPVYADDGISDSPNERYTIEIMLTSVGEYAVTLRVFDVNGNAGNARVVVKR